MSEHAPEPEQLTEEQLRERLAEELKRVQVRDVVVQSVVSLVNLGAHRLGLGPGGEETRDLDQAKLAIDAVRALLPLVDGEDGELAPIRDALAQLQVAYARAAGADGPAEGSDAGGSAQAEPGDGRKAPQAADPGKPAGRDSGLWVPPGSKT